MFGKIALATATIPLIWGCLTTDSLACLVLKGIMSSKSFELNALIDDSRTLSQLYDDNSFGHDGVGIEEGNWPIFSNRGNKIVWNREFELTLNQGIPLSPVFNSDLFSPEYVSIPVEPVDNPIKTSEPSALWGLILIGGLGSFMKVNSNQRINPD